MRILRVIASVNPKGGGPVESISQMRPILEAMGVTADVLSLDDPTARWVRDSPHNVYALGPSKSSYAYSSSVLPWLKAHAKEYDCVVVQGLWQYHGLAVWHALRHSKVPYFVFTHGMLDPWFKKTYPLKHLKKSLYWPWAEYRVLRDARAVLFTCEEERLLARQSFTLYRCNEQVVNYGTSAPTGNAEAQKRAFYERFPQLLGKRHLLFLSRIHPKKGCDLLIEAFARVASAYPNLQLVMAGPDQVGLQAQLENLAKNSGIADRILWTGMISDSIKYGAFHSAEAFVLPSHQENFGIAVAEALACGIPVLISNKVNIWREIEQDEAGLVRDDTLEGTVSLLKGWLILSEPEKKAMRENAKQCFLRRFEIHQAVHSLLQVLKGDSSANESHV